MRAVLALTAVTGFVLVSGCSNRAVYENLQFTQRQDCLQLPPAQYDRCMQAVSQSYDDYERQRTAKGFEATYPATARDQQH